jgi:uncharacterized protein (DUF736 family)
MNLPAEISFIVSQNDKGDNPKRPDYRGEVVIGSATYELAAWKRTKQGTDRKFVSGKLTLKQPKEDPGAYRGEEAAKPAPSEAPKAANDEENVPF